MLDRIERTLGLPPLTQVSNVLKALPDEKKLRLVKSLLDSAAKVRGSPEELQILLELIRLIISANLEQLTAIRDITSNLLKLVKYLPKDMSLKTLPLKEIMEEIRKG